MSSKTMRCPQGALVTRTSAIPLKHPKKGAPAIVREYRIEDEWTEVVIVRHKSNGTRRQTTYEKKSVKHLRCKGKGPVERVDENTLRMRCPDCGDINMNADIWAKEAGL